MELLELEEKIVPISECWEEGPSYDELGTSKFLDENCGISESSDSEKQDSSDDEDYVRKLEKEMEAVHRAKKESEILSGLTGKKERRIKETRRQRVMKEWAAEAETVIEDIEVRNLKRLAQEKEAATLSGEDDDDSVGEEEQLETDTEAPSDKDNQTDKDNESDTDKDFEKEFQPKESMASKVFFNAEFFKDLHVKDRVLKPVANKKRKHLDGDGDDSDDNSIAVEAEKDVDSDGIVEMDDADLPHIPLSDHKRRQLKRKKDAERKLAVEGKKARKQATLLKGLGGTLDEETTALAEGISLKTPIKEVPVCIISGLGVSAAGVSTKTSLLAEIARPEHKDDVAEVQAIGSLMVKKKSRMDLMDGLYNRWAFEDDCNLPEWFKEDDEIARIPEAPITKELFDEYRRKLREISERPIRKVNCNVSNLLYIFL